MLSVVVVSGAFIALVLASIEDLRTGEISDYKSVGLAAFALVVATADSLYSWDYLPLAYALAWGLAYLAFSWVVFYLGQWGGGDVKIMAALGACMGYLQATGFDWPKANFIGIDVHPLISLIVNMGFISVPYAVAYTLILGLRKPETFSDYALRVCNARTFIVLSFALAPSIVSAYLGLLPISTVYMMLPLFYLASLYMKTVEEKVLTKTIPVSALKDWDILAHDLRLDGRLVATKRNIEGVTPKQVAEIKELANDGKIPEKIDIRWGIKFLPVITFSFLATLYVGDGLSVVFALLS